VHRVRELESTRDVLDEDRVARGLRDRFEHRAVAFGLDRGRALLRDVLDRSDEAHDTAVAKHRSTPRADDDLATAGRDDVRDDRERAGVGDRRLDGGADARAVFGAVVVDGSLDVGLRTVGRQVVDQERLPRPEQAAAIDRVLPATDARNRLGLLEERVRALRLAVGEHALRDVLEQENGTCESLLVPPGLGLVADVAPIPAGELERVELDASRPALHRVAQVVDDPSG
jgi:hypothetical protein